MPTPTYTPLATITLTGTPTTVTFSSIVGTYRDLVLVFDAVGSTSTNVNLQFNDDGANVYTAVRMNGTGTAAQGGTYSGTVAIITESAFLTTSSRCVSISHIIDYTQSKHKTVLTRSSNAENGVDIWANRWANTAAITKITVNSSGFAASSTFTLYGVIA